MHAGENNFSSKDDEKEVQSNFFRTNIKGPLIFVRNNGSSSYPYVLPSEYTGLYPIQLRILVLLRQTFVLSLFFLTRIHCTVFVVLMLNAPELGRQCEHQVWALAKQARPVSDGDHSTGSSLGRLHCAHLAVSKSF